MGQWGLSPLSHFPSCNEISDFCALREIICNPTVAERLFRPIESNFTPHFMHICGLSIANISPPKEFWPQNLQIIPLSAHETQFSLRADVSGLQIHPMALLVWA